MITNEMSITPWPMPPNWPIKAAEKCYKKWGSKVKFEQDLADYVLNGFVLSQPNVFAMVKIIDFKGEPAWFVRMVVGELRVLLAALPWYLPKICFCRRNEARLRAYSLDRLVELANRKGVT